MPLELEKKNSFRCFNKDLHFNLIKGKNVNISKKQNIEVIRLLENEVDFIATDPNFEIARDTTCI